MAGDQPFSEVGESQAIGELILFQADDGAHVQLRARGGTVWLTQGSICVRQVPVRRCCSAGESPAAVPYFR